MVPFCLSLLPRKLLLIILPADCFVVVPPPRNDGTGLLIVICHCEELRLSSLPRGTVCVIARRYGFRHCEEAWFPSLRGGTTKQSAYVSNNAVLFVATAKKTFVYFIISRLLRCRTSALQ